MGRRKKSSLLQQNQTQKSPKKIYKQRKDMVLKKAFELSTLCEIDVGVIIFGPDNNPPLIWPNEPEALHNIVTRYKKTGHVERCKRAKNVSCFRNINNGNENVRKDVNLVTAKFPMSSSNEIDNFSKEELMGLYSLIEAKIEAVNTRISMIKSNGPIFGTTNNSMFDDGVQFYDEGLLGLLLDQSMVINKGFMGNYQSGYFVNHGDYYAKYAEDQRLRFELMMMYGGDYCNLTSSDNVGDKTGLLFLGDEFSDGVMSNDDTSSCLECSIDDLFSELPKLAEHGGGQSRDRDRDRGQGELPFDGVMSDDNDDDTSSMEWSFEEIFNQIPEEVRYVGDQDQSQGQGQEPFDFDFDLVEQLIS